MPTRCTITVLSTIDFAVAVPTPTGPPARRVAVVAPTSTMTVAIAMPLITLYKRSGGFWNIQKIRKNPPLDTSPICWTTAR